jgi:hypothetical protein
VFADNPALAVGQYTAALLERMRRSMGQDTTMHAVVEQASADVAALGDRTQVPAIYENMGVLSPYAYFHGVHGLLPMLVSGTAAGGPPTTIIRVNDVCGKLLETFQDKVGGREGDVACYVPPLVVEELPLGKSATAFVADLDAGRTRETAGAVGTRSAVELLADVEALFLQDESQSADRQLLVVAGEGGSGKTTFLLGMGSRAAAECRAHLQSPAAAPKLPPWTPVLLELRHFSTEQLVGALPRHLERACGLPREAVAALQGVRDPAGATRVPLVRLLVLCDGTDEMVDGGNGKSVFESFVANLCGGPGKAWPCTALRVVVTSRCESGGVPAVRRLLLPFSTAQVSCVRMLRLRPAGSRRAGPTHSLVGGRTQRCRPRAAPAYPCVGLRCLRVVCMMACDGALLRWLAR